MAEYMIEYTSRENTVFSREFTEVERMEDYGGALQRYDELQEDESIIYAKITRNGKTVREGERTEGEWIELL